MELFIKDRLYIPAILPKEGTFKQFNIKKSILQKIEISHSERERVGLREDGESKRIEWDTEKDIALNLDFSEEEMNYLKEACEKITDNQLPDDMWTTIEKLYDDENK